MYLKKDIKRNRGFSLIELLIAMAIMSIVMVMVTQFMGTTSAALRKTKKNLAIQTEALEVGTQFSDALVQATYMRVQTMDNQLYSLDTTLSGERRNRIASVVEPLSGSLVVDNYPNYISNSAAKRKIIVNKSDFSLVNSSGSRYPLTGDVDNTVVSSFRLLTKNGDAANPLYVKPQYIYLQYEKKVGSVVTPSYVIFYFTADHKIYMDRGTLTVAAPNGDGFVAAVASVDANSAKGLGLLTEHADDSYFSADPDSEVVFMDVKFVNPKYAQYDYHYEETITLRNSNVLTVEPQKLFFK